MWRKPFLGGRVEVLTAWLGRGGKLGDVAELLSRFFGMMSTYQWLVPAGLWASCWEPIFLQLEISPTLPSHPFLPSQGLGVCGVVFGMDDRQLWFIGGYPMQAPGISFLSPFTYLFFGLFFFFFWILQFSFSMDLHWTISFYVTWPSGSGSQARNPLLQVGFLGHISWHRAILKILIDGFLQLWSYSHTATAYTWLFHGLPF